ncbi:DUF6777 domain-containing protein [Streptomyces sp. NBC_00140]|uniref:DUF6777 domain-containing protein n=1 Tax=Streptomyces sp. NBC_00140 TaxID=2975664 RepID=UPI00225B5F74|nr:DUF6777 domain-containing protein [Streptomyces sp. NBC_00140]MCX5329733.1 hypothetical protein [Streptomyces sp. NBC_00140]
MRPSTGTFVTACALSTALIAVGCVGSGDETTNSSGELFLQPVAAPGPDPFTDSTQTSTATPSPVTRTQQPAQSGVRSISGGTPGLYGGTVGSGSCDVNRQIGHLTADRAKGWAFAQVEGISQDSIPSYLRSLTSVVLRADTRVTNHGYRDGRTTTYQSVLQSGTAVLVDTRGVPRVRCACGNPLTPARATSGGTVTSGRPWSGYRHGPVVVVAPAPRVITHITIIDIVDNTWIERRCGHDTRHDHVVPRPQPPTSTHTPSPSRSESGAPESWSDASPSTDASADPSVFPSAGESASPSEESSAPDSPATDCVTPTATVTPGVPVTGTPATEDPACPAATVTATPPTVPDEPTVGDPSVTEEEVGPETVPDTPDVPDGGGLIPDGPDEPTATDSIFDSPTGVFGG